MVRKPVGCVQGHRKVVGVIRGGGGGEVGLHVDLLYI